MIEAFVGLVGGGKTFGSTRRMCEYVIRGGVVATNILFVGYDDSSQSFNEDSPFLSYLRSRGWEYQPGQYIYIPFEVMCENANWFERVPGGSSREKRTLLVIDESTDLFDTLDRNKLSSDSSYRALFRFLRLSRHAHIDVLFICQDYFSINSRLRGLCGAIWKSTDMSNFRLPTFHVPLPFNCFMLQKFDRTGKLELFREFIAKDSRIFSIYESEAFHDSLGISFSGVIGDGRINGGRKMNLWQKVLLFCSFGLAVYSVHRFKSMDSKFDRVFSEIRSLRLDTQQSVEFSPESSEYVVSNPDVSPPSDEFLRGEYEYSYLGSYPQLYFRGNLVKEKMVTEYGYCLKITNDYALCVDGDKRVYLLPALPARPPKTTAFALDGEAGRDENVFSRARARLD